MAAGALVKITGTAIKSSKFLGKGAVKNTGAITTAQKTKKIPTDNSGKLTKRNISQGFNFASGVYDAFKKEEVTKKSSSGNDILKIVQSIEKKVIKIDSLLKNKLDFSKKVQDKKRKDSERQRFKSQEEKIESPKKFDVKENLSKSLPKTSFFDVIKRFIFFTVLGWLYDKIVPLIPSIMKVFGKVMDAAYFAMEVFGGLANGLTKFLAGGIRLVNGLTKTLAVISGARTDKEIQDFEKKFNRMIDLTILAAMLAGDIGFDIFDFLKKGNKGKGGAQAARGAKGLLKGGVGRSIKRIGIKLGGKAGGKAAQGLTKGVSSFANKATGGIFARGGGRALTRLAIKIGGKGGGQLVKGTGNLLGKAAGPIATVAMAAWDFTNRKASGQSNLQAGAGTAAGVGGALAGAKGGAVVGAAIGSIVPGLGTALGGLIGGAIGAAGGAWAASSLVDKATGANKAVPKEPTIPNTGYSLGGIIRKYEKGGVIIPSKQRPQETRPGKDVGGYYEISKLFPDPTGSGKGGGGSEDLQSNTSKFVWWNPFTWGTKNQPEQVQQTESNFSLNGPSGGALKSLRDTSSTFKKIPFVGELMGIAVDIAMGQKPDKPFYKRISKGLVFLAQRLSTTKSLNLVSDIGGDVQRLASGGITETVNQDFTNIRFTEKSIEEVSDTLSVIIEKGANDSLTDIRKEILKSKIAISKRSADSSGGGSSGGGGSSDPNFGGDAEATPGDDSGGNYDDTPHGQPGGAPVKTTSGFNAGKGDKSRKIFLHWTAGSYTTPFSNYHTTFLGDGRAVRYTPYGQDKGTHTGGGNTNSVGLSIAAMGGEGTGPNNFGKYPPTSAQVSAMALEAARLAVAWGWDESTIDSNVRTHGEWERFGTSTGILSGKPQRWDLDKLQQSDPLNSGGNKLRKMIKGYFKQLKKGSTTDSSTGTTKVSSSGATLQEMSLSSATEVVGDVKPGSGGVQVSGGGADFWALAAIASLENGNPQGQADVAQSIYNRLLSKLNFGQSSNTIKGHIIAPKQYSPVHESNPSLWAAITDKESAIKAVESHKNGKGRGKKIVEEAAKNIKNPGLQQSAKEFVGGRTDFWATSIGMPSSGHSFIVRHGHRFGYFAGPAAIAYGRKNPPVAEVPSLGVNVTIKPGKPQKPGSGGPVGDPGSGDGKLRFGRTGHLIGMAAGWAHSHFENLRGGMTSQAPTEANLAKLVADSTPAIKKMADSGLKPELSSGKAIKGGQSADYYNSIIREGAARHTHSGPKAAVDVNMPGFPAVPFALKDVRNTPSKGEGINALLKNSNTTALYHLSYKKDGMAFHGKPIKKQGLFELHKDEFVVDKDSVDLFGQDFFESINSIENKTKLSKVYPDLIRRIEETAKGKAYVKKQYDQQHGARVIQADSSSNDSSQKPEDTTRNLEQFNKQEETKTEESQQQGGEKEDDKNQRVRVIPASHSQTGSGFTIKGVTDGNGRPLILSKGGIKAFGEMIQDSKGAVKGSDVASGKRSVAHNRKVGGVPNSNHLGGNALDIHGSSQTWMRRNGRKYGWIINDYPGSHGGHFDYKGKDSNDSGDTLAAMSSDITTDSVIDYGGGGASSGGGGGGSSGGGGGGSSGGGGGGSSGGGGYQPVDVEAEPTESLIPGSQRSRGPTDFRPAAPMAKGAIKLDHKLYEEMGVSSEDWDIFRNTIAHIESKGAYNILGGSGDHYDGRYQLGAAAKTDASRILGIPDPGHNSSARAAFRSNPALQEQMFAAFTMANHKYLMRNPTYAKASPERKLQILGYAHNQGMGGAENWIRTGQVGADGFGTKGTKYTDALAANFAARNKALKDKPQKDDTADNKDRPIEAGGDPGDIEKDQQVAGFTKDKRYGRLGVPNTDGQDTGADLELFGRRGEIPKSFGDNDKSGPYGNRGVEISFPYELVYLDKIPGGRNAGRKSIDVDGTQRRVYKGAEGSAGFGNVGSYFYKDPKSGRMFEVMMGHGNKPFKKFKNGEKIPPGTVVGWQGASGSSDSMQGGVYDHVSFHVNAVDGGDPGPIFDKFVNSLLKGEGAKVTARRREEKKAQAEIAKRKAKEEKKNPIAKAQKAGGNLISSIASSVSSFFGFGNKPKKPSVAKAANPSSKPKIAKAQGGGQIGSPNVKGNQINKFTDYERPGSDKVYYQEKIKYIEVPQKNGSKGQMSMPVGPKPESQDNSYNLRRQ